MGKPDGIRWGRVLFGGFLVEVTLFAITIPVFLFAGTDGILVMVVPALFVVDFLFGYWVARKVQSHLALHGLLVGVVATLIYLGLNLAMSGSLIPILEMYGPFLFLLANASRLLGATLGGVLAQKRLTKQGLG
jgi:hypothetical protein